jgi:hypothetical protein
MGYLKGKSCLMIFENYANLKYKYGQRSFWARGYYVSTVGLNKNTIKKYIREQETEDMFLDKRCVREYNELFQGEVRVTKAIGGTKKLSNGSCQKYHLVGV